MYKQVVASLCGQCVCVCVVRSYNGSGLVRSGPVRSGPVWSWSGPVRGVLAHSLLRSEVLRR